MRVCFVVALVLCLVASPADARRRVVSRTPAMPAVIVITDDFRNGQLGWEAAFADYSPVSAPTMELDAGMRPLPTELNTPGTGFFITGHNRSDDLFMFLSKKLTPADGIEPGRAYGVSFRVVLASNAGSHCVGVGGAPGEGVYLKVGATGNPPQVVLDSTNHFVVNFDKDNQSQSGTEMSVAGNIANGSDDCRGEAPFRSIVREHVHTHAILANPAGEIWLLVGTDSAFEGKTTLYYQRIEVTLTPVVGPI